MSHHASGSLFHHAPFETPRAFVGSKEASVLLVRIRECNSPWPMRWWLGQDTAEFEVWPVEREYQALLNEWPIPLSAEQQYINTAYLVPTVWHSIPHGLETLRGGLVIHAPTYLPAFGSQAPVGSRDGHQGASFAYASGRKFLIE